MEKYLLLASSSDSVEMTQIVECLENREIPVLVEHVNIPLSQKNSSSRETTTADSYRVLVAQDFFQLALSILRRFKQNRAQGNKVYAVIDNEFQIIH